MEDEMTDIVDRIQECVRESPLWIETMIDAVAEIKKLQSDKAAISQTASDYLHTIEQLRAQLATTELPPPALPPVGEWDY
jgi:hypothetical protein